MTSRSCGGHLVQEGAQQRRLPGARAAGHDDVPPGSDGGAQERSQLVVDHPPRGELVERRELEPVPADHDARPSRHLHRREQPAAVGQLQVQLGVGGIEPALAASHARRHEADELDQLVVAVGDRLAGHPRAVVELEPHRVAAADVDVGHVGRVEVGLDPTEAHHRRHHGAEQGQLVVGVQEVHAASQAVRRQTVELTGGEGRGQLAGILGRQPRASRRLPLDLVGRQRLTDATCELHHQRAVRPDDRAGDSLMLVHPAASIGPCPSSAAASVGT